jgi:hypothetical protein
MFGCGDSSARPDAAPSDASSTDAQAIDAAPRVAVSGFVASQAGRIAGATVTTDDVTTTTTASDGTYTILVGENGPHFVRAAMSTFSGEELGVLTTTSAQNGVDPILTSDADNAAIALALDPPDTFDPTRGTVTVVFTGQVLSAMSATISAGHSMSYTFVGANPRYSAALIAGGRSVLVFPNVIPGMTTVTPNTGGSGITCSASPAITSWRVDAHTATVVMLTCS